MEICFLVEGAIYLVVGKETRSPLRIKSSSAIELRRSRIQTVEPSAGDQKAESVDLSAAKGRGAMTIIERLTRRQRSVSKIKDLIEKANLHSNC